ncbi:M1 family metallopeptidase [Olivibacter sp. XZL3]|uniref:M1 family metallopeptidase n=1 Tax=Olivibacter sp. XZL3 TaxID=1735116 RepID=UPI001065BD8C|nr:M1 family metallopeptidase [Olivibacter sp. XZL3]
MKSSITFVITCLLLISTSAFAQFRPEKIFGPDFYTYKGDNYRSASGKPGPGYWQNRADYRIKASFDTLNYRLQGEVEIDYYNNSPDELDALWLQLDQNNSLPTARGNRLNAPTKPADEDKGYRISEVKIERNGAWINADYLIDDTRMQVRLADLPLKAGEQLKLAIKYAYVLQKRSGGGRSGYLDTKNGKIFEFSYWYPRLCVYDDYSGWNTLPFMGSGEMYLDYGDIDFSVTVPSGALVVGTGDLINKEEVFTEKVLSRLAQAQDSNVTVMIRPASELQERPTKTKQGTTTWHFNMKNTRDAAWAMSTAFIWDAARINLPEGKTALAQSVYPIESTADSIAWPRSTEMIKASVEHYSKKWFPFPYLVATSVAGPVGGMEFPGMAFNGYKAKPYTMYLLASHEIGHTWFPMIVGSNERRYPFMDEGFNTFLNILAQEEFNNGEFAPKRDGEYAPGGGHPADEIIQVIAESGEANTLMTPPDAMERKYVHPLAYFKSAFGLVLLRDVILGPEKFDYAFRQYIHHWAFKHPQPADFFRSMENGTGEDLSWFWRGWYYHNWQLDQAIKEVSYVDNEPQKGALITVENKQQMAMPILVRVKESNGAVHNFSVPVEVWQRGAEAKFSVDTESKIVSVELDPEHKIPDIDRSNNVWQ